MPHDLAPLGARGGARRLRARRTGGMGGWKAHPLENRWEAFTEGSAVVLTIGNPLETPVGSTVGSEKEHTTTYVSG